MQQPQESHADQEAARVAREAERATTQSNDAKLRVEIDSLRRQAAREKIEWMEATKTQLDATLQKAMRDEKQKWKDHYTARLTEVEQQQRALVASEVARALESQKAKWMKEQERGLATALASQAQKFTLAHAQQLKMVGDQVAAEKARWTAREAHFAQVLQHEQTKFHAQLTHSQQAFTAEQAAHRRMAQIMEAQQGRDSHGAQQLKARESLMQNEFLEREAKFQLQYKEHVQAQYVAPLQKENRALRDQLEMLALIQAQRPTTPQAKLTPPRPSAPTPVHFLQEEKEAVPEPSPTPRTRPSEPSKYESEQYAMKMQIKLLESQLQAVQTATPSRKLRREGSPLSSQKPANVNPLPSIPAATTDLPSRVDASDYPFGSSAVKHAQLLSRMQLAEAMHQANATVSVPLAPSAPSVFAPRPSVTPPSSTALEEELYRTHTDFLAHRAHGARDQLTKLETTQILDRVVEHTVFERSRAVDAALDQSVRSSLNESRREHRPDNPTITGRQDQHARLLQMELELRATQESINQLTNLVDAAIPQSAASASLLHHLPPLPALPPPADSAASTAKLSAVITELKDELGHTYELLGSEKRNRVLDHLQSALKAREEQHDATLHANALLEMPTPPISPRAFLNSSVAMPSTSMIASTPIPPPLPPSSAMVVPPSIPSTPIRASTNFGSFLDQSLTSFASSFHATPLPTATFSMQPPMPITPSPNDGSLGTAAWELRQAQQRTEEARLRMQLSLSQFSIAPPPASISTDPVPVQLSPALPIPSPPVAPSSAPASRPYAPTALPALPALPPNSSAAAFRALLRPAASKVT